MAIASIRDTMVWKKLNNIKYQNITKSITIYQHVIGSYHDIRQRLLLQSLESRYKVLQETLPSNLLFLLAFVCALHCLDFSFLFRSLPDDANCI